MRKTFSFTALLILSGLWLGTPTPSFGSPRAHFVLYGEAAWYSSGSCRREGTSGILTASGERFYDHGLTCAMRRRDFGKYYRVTNLANGKSVIVRHNDFGPARKWRNLQTGKTHDLSGRVIDLSKGAFQRIANPRQGVIRHAKVESLH